MALAPSGEPLRECPWLQMYSHDNDEPGGANAQFAGRQKSMVGEWMKRADSACLTRLLSWLQPKARAAEIMRTGRLAHRSVRMADITCRTRFFPVYQERQERRSRSGVVARPRRASAALPRNWSPCRPRNCRQSLALSCRPLALDAAGLLNWQTAASLEFTCAAPANQQSRRGLVPRAA